MAVARTLIGVASLVTVVLLWAASALVIKMVTGEGEPKAGALLLTFYSQAHCIVLLLPLVWKRTGMADVFRAISPMRILILGLLYNLAQAAYNLSFKYLSLTTNTILSSSSPLFTFIFGLLVLRQRFLWLSGLGVLGAIGGGALTALFKPTLPGKESTELDSLTGKVLAVGGAVVFGLVNTLMRKWLKEEKHTDTLFGLIGVISIVIAGPVLAVAHFSRVEVFMLPPEDCWWIMSLNALLGTVLSSYLWGVSVTILGPMIVSVCVVATIPVCAVIDQIRHQLSFSPEYVTGMVLVILAVSVVAYDQTRYSNEQVKDEGDAVSAI